MNTRDITGTELKDANANEVAPWPTNRNDTRLADGTAAAEAIRRKRGQAASPPAPAPAPLDLAALTDLCGRTLLSPAFFLGPRDSSVEPLTLGRSHYPRLGMQFAFYQTEFSTQSTLLPVYLY